MTPPVQPVPAADQSQQVTDLLNRIFNSSNWRGEVEKTVKKNTRLQQLVRDQKAQLDKFAAKFNLDTGEPKEGKLLTKDEAVAYQAFVDLKVKPEDLKTVLTEHGKLKAKDDERAAEERFADAAEALGFENVPALTRWLTREKLVLEFKDQRVEDEDTGKKVLMRMPYVRPAEDEKAVLEPLEEYIEREVPEFLDIFKTKPESDDDEEEGGREEGGDLDTDEMVRRASADAERRVSGKGGKSGVRVPATRSARSDNAGTKDSKKLADLEKDSRSSSLYSSI
jgi:hypothetical protein